MHEELKEFGLNDNEIKVYIACLELGSCSVTRISERSNTYRTLTYEILNSLAEKGLVSHTIKERKKYFQAAHPDTLVKILESKKRRIKTVLPKLHALQKTVEDKPGVTLYEGKEGIKTVLEMILTETKEFCILSPKKSIVKMFKYWFPHFVDRRVEKGIYIKMLIDSEPLTTKLMDYRVIPHKFDAGFFLYKNKVIHTNFHLQNPTAVVIENKEIADSMRIVFNMAWENAKPTS